MTFYQSIVRHYDEIFPVGKAQLAFLADAAGSAPAAILDIACGTGGYAAALARAGHRVMACDLDPAMVEQAAQKPDVQAFTADMLDLENALPQGCSKFDLVYCIGNSLVHLPDEQAAGHALCQMAAALRDNGRLLIQIINYDRILDQKVDHLPTIVNQAAGLTFERKYECRADGRIDFNTRLAVNGENNGQPLCNTVPLLPLRAAALQKLCRDAGLAQIRLYGSYTGDLFDPALSIQLILQAVRQPVEPGERNPG